MTQESTLILYSSNHSDQIDAIMRNNFETKTQIEKMAKYMETILEKLSSQKGHDESVLNDPDLERLDGQLEKKHT